MFVIYIFIYICLISQYEQHIESKIIQFKKLFDVAQRVGWGVLCEVSLMGFSSAKLTNLKNKQTNKQKKQSWEIKS